MGVRGPSRRTAEHRQPDRLVGAVLAEQHDEWTEGRRYLDLDVLSRCRIRPVTDPEPETDKEEFTIPALSA